MKILALTDMAGSKCTNENAYSSIKNYDKNCDLSQDADLVKLYNDNCMNKRDCNIDLSALLTKWPANCRLS